MCKLLTPVGMGPKVRIYELSHDSLVLVWLHQTWTTEAALLSFLFDLAGGGDITRITIVIKCIVDITPPHKLCVISESI